MSPLRCSYLNGRTLHFQLRQDKFPIAEPKLCFRIIQHSAVLGEGLAPDGTGLISKLGQSRLTVSWAFLRLPTRPFSGVRGPRPLGPDEIPVGAFFGRRRMSSPGFGQRPTPTNLEAYRQA